MLSRPLQRNGRRAVSLSYSQGPPRQRGQTRAAVKSRSGATTASLAAEPMAGVSVPAVTARAARPS